MKRVEPISRSSLVTMEEQQQLLNWNDTRAEIPIDTAIHEMFEATVARHPDAIALTCGTQQISYAKLNEKSNQLAWHLRTLGIGPETLAGLCLERSLSLVIALLGILKAGGAYVPLDPEYPKERQDFILEDTELKVVVTQANLQHRFSSDKLTLVAIDTEWSVISEHPPTTPNSRVAAGNLAYCLYTSGSTGKPKGVAVSHAGVVNHMLHMRRALDLQANDRMLQFTSITIDAFLEELFPAWLAGATVVLRPQAMLTNQEFLQSLHDNNISVLSLPTSYWQQWVEELSSADELPASLRLVFVGGEKVLQEKLRRWMELTRSRNIAWMVDYGPTEATISCSTFRQHDADEIVDSPIGWPISNTQIYLLDKDLNTVTSGAPGEIYIGGIGLARGYLNRPDLTAEKFLPNPFGEAGSRIYRTGDLGRYMSDGNIQFVGRGDSQVKIRGFRIEPAEIEAALVRCDGVKQAVVIAQEEIAGDPRLVAYVVPAQFNESEVRSQLAEMLPAVMVPADFVALDQLPLSTVTGKVDRAKLPQPLRPLVLNEGSVLELALANLWIEIVGTAPHSLDADFFLFGGDSLRALQLLSRLSNQLNLQLVFADLFHARTIRQLSNVLLTKYQQQEPSTNGDLERIVAERLGPAIASVAVANDRRGTERRRHASNGQKQLWFLNQAQGDAATYSIPLAYRVRGNLSIERLDKALTAMIARHDVLRTALVIDHDEIWQEITALREFASQQCSANTFEEAMQIARNEAKIPFDLTQAPLFRSTVIRVSASEVLLLFNVHHTVFDAWSLGVFWRELIELYSTSTLDPPGLQYASFAERQREWLLTPEADAQRKFWREKLAGDLPLLRLNTTLTTEAVPLGLGDIEPFEISSDLGERITATATAHGTTEFVVLLAAFLSVLHRYALQNQLILGVPAACRSWPEVENTIGYFVNTLPLRIEFADGLRFNELMQEVAPALSEAITHQDLPFDEIVDLLKLTRQSEVNPVFQTVFVMQTTPIDSTLKIEGLEIEEVVVHSGTAKFDLTCSARKYGVGFRGELEYSLDVLTKKQAAQFVDAFLNLLSDAIRRPAARLDELSLVSDHESMALVAAANSQFEAYPDLKPVHSYFELQAARNPDAIAIEAGEKSISYRQLNERANRLAQYLKTMGAAPETRVAICMDRSIDLVVALLATLKAGAAFVPLDPRAGYERSQTICLDAGAKLLITESAYKRNLENITSITLIDVTSSFEEQPAKNPPVSLSPLNAAYIYYTSGSTGIPKGVIIEHCCAMNRLEWLRNRYPLSVGDRVLHKTPLIFDVAIWEIFGTLMSGATILMANPQAEADVVHISRLLRTKRTVFAHFVPSMLDAFLSFAPCESYPDLRWVQLSGEAVPTRLLDGFAKHFSAEFHNCYGQTETSEVACWEGLTSDHRAATVPMGKQIGIYRLYILDRNLNPVPRGVPGELCVAGIEGLARGYHGRPDMTAEKFVPNPYAVVAGERLYRTGDLARLDENGVIEYLGRYDQQTKIRGCRVEPGEVEFVLASHPSVKACAVIAHPDETGVNELIAYAVSEEISAMELGAYAERKLPSYMLPSAYIFIPELPLTPSGKLDRLRLPRPQAIDFEARAEDQVPQTELEQRVVELWKQVLGLKKLGRTANFFAVGGNSLKSIQVLTRLREAFGIELSVRDFFNAPTVEDLASLIEARLLRLVASLTDDEAEKLLRDVEY